jgi:hypothetical protein
VIGVAGRQLQRVLARRKVEIGLGLASIEVKVILVGRDRLVRIERASVGVDQEVVMATFGALSPARVTPMLRSPKRIQNGPLTVCPSRSQMMYT